MKTARPMQHRRETPTPEPPACPYCGNMAQLATGKEIYPHRRDLHGKKFWQCKPCDAYVGCHQQTKKPLGRLANESLRAAKMQAHRHFDKLWRSGEMTRSEAYAWLADALGIPRTETHIGMFDEQTCNRVVEACRNRMAV